LISRAIGRAARTALLLTPAETKTIKITYTLNDLPLQTYTIDDTALLRRYIAGEVSWDVARDHVTVEYTGPTPREMQKGLDVLPRRDEEERPATQSASEEGGNVLEIRRQDSSLSKFTVAPFNLRVYFVDPSGAASYDTFALFGYTQHLGDGLFFEGAARLKLLENVSDITQPSPSVLPHVRTDINLYRQEGDAAKLNSLLLNKYFKPGQFVYGRVSAGYYEEMFAGTGGQILYLSEQRHWAFDLSMDWLKQRDPEKSVGFRDYSVVTTVGSIHYRFPKYGITTTARVGRFLAKDEGVRFEIKRRFRSGIETGIWFTHTNENDMTRPNREGDNFRDKGLFISVPLSSMLTKDTQQRSNLAIAEATRDVGQMVESPGDLYRMVERPLMLDNGEYNPLTDFAK
ncbi:MAG: YjbH domain-containing protein, partial [Sulfuricaulis sp.]|uniref:YjbH domain-containing protein n=1 Tax=Sulfuricaulis sp. TaxID=2003553 RepID=UPI003C4FEC97